MLGKILIVAAVFFGSMGLAGYFVVARDLMPRQVHLQPAPKRCDTTRVAPGTLARTPFKTADDLRRFLLESSADWGRAEKALAPLLKEREAEARTCVAASRSATGVRAVVEYRFSYSDHEVRGAEFVLRSRKLAGPDLSGVRACLERHVLTGAISARVEERFASAYDGLYPYRYVIEL